MSGCGIGWTWRWRPTLIGALAFALCAAGVNAQPSATPGQRLAFDYRTSDLTEFQVTRFEQQMDGGAWTNLGLPETVTDPATPAGFSTFAVPIPALTPGSHTVSVRACNATCGDGSAPYTFQMVAQPPAPSGTRILGGS